MTQSSSEPEWQRTGPSQFPTDPAPYGQAHQPAAQQQPHGQLGYPTDHRYEQPYQQQPYPYPYQPGHQQAQYAQQGPFTGPMPQFPYATQSFVVQQTSNNGLGVAGFVTGLLGLIFCWVPVLGIVLAVLGIILGGAGIASGRKSGAGVGLAVAGLVLGIIALIPAIIFIAALSSLGS